MEHTARESRINAGLDKHFKTNKGAWFITQPDYYAEDVVVLNHDLSVREKLDPLKVAAHIFRADKSIRLIRWKSGGMNITRDTIRRWGIPI